MASTSSSQPDGESSYKQQVSPQLDYEKAKKRYYKSITICYGGKNKGLYVEQYLRAINVLNNVNHLLTKPTAEEEAYCDKYELLTENGITCLIKRRIKTDDPIMRYIPIDDSFDILAKIHLTIGHGKLEEMHEYVKDNYIISSMFVDMLFLCCNVCKVKLKMFTDHDKDDGKLIKDNTVYLDLIDMADRPDGLFTCLLIYVYKHSSFTLLRPLMKKCPLEISMEFLKIFLDFGPPTKFEIFVQESKIFNEALGHLKTISKSYCIPVTDSCKLGMDSEMPSKVLKNIQEWVADVHNINWGLGCHVLQWKLNNQANCGSNYDNKDEFQRYKTPYTQFFGFNLQVPLDTGNIGNVCEKETNDNSLPITETITVKDNDNDSELEDDPVILHEPSGDNTFYKTMSTTSIQIAEIESKSTNDNTMDIVEEETNINCYVCQSKIYKIYHCSECKNPVHIFCTTRNESNSPDETPSFTCSFCMVNSHSIIKTKKNKRKQKK